MLFAGMMMLSWPHTVRATVISVIDSPTFTGDQLQKTGFGSTQGAYRSYNTTKNLAYNGITPVVSGTIAVPGLDVIHHAAYLNDGYYGNGASWIDTSSNSWIKLDLGGDYYVSSIAFGRDRLGYFDDRDPGRFIIEVSADDTFGYSVVADSSVLSFSGYINQNDTVLTTFTDPVEARYIKITFANAGAAIDEVDVRGVSAVPEPASLLFLCTGVAVQAALRKLRKNGEVLSVLMQNIG